MTTSRVIEVTRRGRTGAQGNPGSTAFDAVTTAGTSTVYTLANDTPIISYDDGYGVTIDAHVTNGAAPTINVDTLGAVAIKKLSGGSVVAIAAGDMVADHFYMIHYSAVESCFLLFGRKNDTIGVDVQAYSEDINSTSGTNTGDEVPATDSVAGVVELGTVAEIRAWAARVFKADSLLLAAAEQTLTDAANITFAPTSGFNATVTLTATRILDNPSTMPVGSTGRIRVVQDGTGGWGLTYGTYYESANGGAAPVIADGIGEETILYYDIITATRIVLSSLPNVAAIV